MSTLADRTISALRGNHDQLTARVSGFDEEDLARQSGSSEWDVADVLSHLGSGAEIALAGLQAGIAGHEVPGQDFNQLVWDRWNAMSAQEKAQGFLGANEQLVTAYESLDATARQEVQVKLAFLPFPADVALLSGLRLRHVLDARAAAQGHPPDRYRYRQPVHFVLRRNALTSVNWWGYGRLDTRFATVPQAGGVRPGVPGEADVDLGLMTSVLLAGRMAVF